jgi:hypothetical protein
MLTVYRLWESLWFSYEWCTASAAEFGLLMKLGRPIQMCSDET